MLSPLSVTLDGIDGRLMSVALIQMHQCQIVRPVQLDLALLHEIQQVLVELKIPMTMASVTLPLVVTRPCNGLNLSIILQHWNNILFRIKQHYVRNVHWR